MEKISRKRVQDVTRDEAEHKRVDDLAVKKTKLRSELVGMQIADVQLIGTAANRLRGLVIPLSCGHDFTVEIVGKGRKFLRLTVK